MFSFGVFVGLPNSFLFPRFIIISKRIGPSSDFNFNIFFFNSISVDTLNEFLYLQLFANETKFIIFPTVGCQPTESWDSLLRIICLKFFICFDPMIPNEPICIITDPSPSKQNTCFLGFEIAIPNAICDA